MEQIIQINKGLLKNKKINKTLFCTSKSHFCFLSFQSPPDTYPFPSKTLEPTVGPLQHKDHCTQPQLLPPPHNLLEVVVEGGTHQRLALPQVVVEVVYL